jgi:hypothetical protein
MSLALAEPYALALQQALAFCHERTDPFGIVASGSIVRGTGDASSDLDIYVLHAHPWRQRVQRFFNGVPCEIFINAPTHVAGYFQEENKAGRPITAHLLATGAIMFGADDVRLTDVIARARVWLDTPPHISDEALTLRRYLIATAFEDARDVVERDLHTALLLLGEAVPEALAYSFLAAGRNVPRHKDMLLVLARVNPALAAAVAQFVGEPNPAARYAAALVIADLTVHARGFFAWESACP